MKKISSKNRTKESTPVLESAGFSLFAQCVSSLADLGELAQKNPATQTVWLKYLQKLQQEVSEAQTQMSANLQGAQHPAQQADSAAG